MEKLIVNGLCHSFGFKQILENISFTLEKGEIISILGVSGAGKTTLLRLCANLLDLEDDEYVKNSFKSSAFAFQDARLLPWKNAVSNIALAMIAKGERSKFALEKARKIAFEFGLDEDDLEKFPKDLSGGMKQRVSFARALVCYPSLLFLDEPFTGLDIGLKKELKMHILKVAKETNMSILFITHDPLEAVTLSDRVLLLKSEPASVCKVFEIEKCKFERDESYIHQKTSQILQDEQILKVFEMDKI